MDVVSPSVKLLTLFASTSLQGDGVWGRQEGSEVGWKLPEMSGLRGCDWWHKSGGSHWGGDPRAGHWALPVQHPLEWPEGWGTPSAPPERNQTGRSGWLPAGLGLQGDLAHWEWKESGNGRNLLIFNKGKCQDHSLGRNNPKPQHTLGPSAWKAALQKDLAGPGDSTRTRQ